MAGIRTLTSAAALLVAVAVALMSPVVAPALGGPNDASSIELVEQPGRYDGAHVTFRGEAIGESMVRGAGAWIHLNDDAYMYKNVEEGAPLGGYNTGMPVWIPAELAERIGTFGDYRHQGDVVSVDGVFNAACAEHGGDMDIHASTLEVEVAGRTAQDPVKPGKLITAVVVTLLAAGLWYLDRRLSHREHRGFTRGR